VSALPCSRILQAQHGRQLGPRIEIHGQLVAWSAARSLIVRWSFSTEFTELGVSFFRLELDRTVLLGQGLHRGPKELYEHRNSLG
jgi:hypothetical protein